MKFHAINYNPSKILVTGVSGTGKSTWFLKFLLNAPQEQRFVYDHQGEIAQRLGVLPAMDLDQLVNQSERETLVIFDPCLMFPRDVESGFNFFCDYVFELSKVTAQSHSKLFCCDELQLLTGVNVIPPELQGILQTGRRARLDFIACSQQVNEVHNKIRSQMTDYICFRSTDPLVLDALKERGISPDLVSQLKPGEYLSKDMRYGTPDYLGEIPLDGSI